MIAIVGASTALLDSVAVIVNPAIEFATLKLFVPSITNPVFVMLGKADRRRIVVWSAGSWNSIRETGLPL